MASWIGSRKRGFKVENRVEGINGGSAPPLLSSPQKTMLPYRKIGRPIAVYV